MPIRCGSTIATAAQVSKRTIYDHFKTKKALFEAMLIHHWEGIAVDAVEYLEGSGNTRQYLKRFAQIFLKFIYQPETIALFRLLIAESPQFPDLISHLVVDGKAPFTRTLITFLQKKNQDGELCINDAERAAAYFIGMLKEYHFWPMMLGFIAETNLANPNTLIDDVVKVFIKAFAVD